MRRVLTAALVAAVVWLPPVRLEGARWEPEPGVRLHGRHDAMVARFSLARGAIGGWLSGWVADAFDAAGDLICFRPGTFDVSVEGIVAGYFQPASNCGFDVTLRVAGLAELGTGEVAARPMTLRWTDLAGRVYTLAYGETESGLTHHVRLTCFEAGATGCAAAVGDSDAGSFRSETGVLRETGPRARLTLATGPNLDGERVIGNYDVPFALRIEAENGG